MKIAKPILLVTTPLGVIGGLREAWRFNPGLAFLMFALIALISAALAMVVKTVRDEKKAEAARLAAEGEAPSPP
jgi:phosphotransferase system  glucose/maltose/N-acetylglucosamine-specific IIC component